MTDINNPGPSTAAAIQQQATGSDPSAVAQAIQQQTDPGQPPAADGDTVPRDWWEREKQGRMRERNLYRKGQQLLDELDDQSQEAIVSLAEMARRGDVDGIIGWSIDTAKNLSGGDIAAAIARRQGGQVPPLQQQVPQGPGFNQPPATPPVDLDTVQRTVQEQVQQALRQEQIRQQIDGEMRAAGYPPEDPAGQAIIRYASNTGASIAQAVQWFENDLAQRFAARQQALVGAAGQVPPPSPTGAPAPGAGANLSPRESAIRRLQQAQRGGPTA